MMVAGTSPASSRALLRAPRVGLGGRRSGGRAHCVRVRAEESDGPSPSVQFSNAQRAAGALTEAAAAGTPEAASPDPLSAEAFLESRTAKKESSPGSASGAARAETSAASGVGDRVDASGGLEEGVGLEGTKMKKGIKFQPVHGRLGLVRRESKLAPYEHQVWNRYMRYENRYHEITNNEGSLEAFGDSYKTFGLHPAPGGAPGDVRYFEYAPGVKRLSLMGDFNKWEPWEHNGVRDGDPETGEGYTGKWTVDIPAAAGLKHGSQVRVVMETEDGRIIDRIPAWIHAITPCADEGANYHNGVYHDPPAGEKHQWKHEKPQTKPRSLRIYEAHVGMSSEEHRCGTYREFANDILPRVASLGYNVVQLMAVADHAYYASFGYQVTNFFAVAHRSGGPEDLKYLVDKAHGLGLQVFVDVVHAHASDNTIDGLNEFDGSFGGHLFHGGDLAWHGLWGTRMFNYGHYETLRFLLSNLRYWTEEYRIDGFRFDGVTAMLYYHRGIHWQFHGQEAEFFAEEHADYDAAAYLMLANHMLRQGEYCDAVTTIAEDVSGQTGACRPFSHGGLGFDLRLSMGPPDQWSQLASEPDFNWTPSRIMGLITARNNEPAVAYVESHDQCLVGDKTFAFRLMDANMYEGMSKGLDPINPAVERGLALHKIARLLTMGLGGEAWLGFMGNEFGHPEWVDFPREGNNLSFHHARRQWSLRDNPDLYFGDLERFDGALMKCDEEHGLLIANSYGAMPYAHHCKDDSGVLAVHVGDCLVVANLHPHESYPYYRVGSAVAGKYELVLDTDATEFGGWGRLAPGSEASTEGGSCDWQGTGVCLYLPSRSAQVYRLKDQWDLPPEAEYSQHYHYDDDWGSAEDDGTGGGGDDAVWW